MKREITFRGLAADGRWYYGDLISDDRGTYISYVVNIAPSWTEPGGDTQFIKVSVDYNTVGQFTGLKDKKDVEIYEDDIIKSALTDEPVPVIYDLQYAQFTYGSCEFNIEAKVNTTEVIGNIHEHPNLLIS